MRMFRKLRLSSDTLAVQFVFLALLNLFPAIQ